MVLQQCYLYLEAGLVKLGKFEGDVVEIVGRGHSVASLYADGDLTKLTTSADAVSKAYDDAGVTAGDIDVAEVHDCFAVTECMMYEKLLDLLLLVKGQNLRHLVKPVSTERSQ